VCFARALCATCTAFRLPPVLGQAHAFIRPSDGSARIDLRSAAPGCSCVVKQDFWSWVFIQLLALHVACSRLCSPDMAVLLATAVHAAPVLSMCAKVSQRIFEAVTASPRGPMVLRQYTAYLTSSWGALCLHCSVGR
jgi:hypothetical protein